MLFKLAYGTGHIDVEIPFSENLISVINPKPITPLINEKQALKEAIENPYGTVLLKQLIKPGESVAIVISDKTRPTPSYKIVPVLLEVLKQIPSGEVVIINGTGTHKANSRTELEVMLGKEIVENYEVINHDCYDKENLVYLGQTRRDTPIWLNKKYVEAERKIVIGFIEPHFFAGFSGGPKGIVPGVAGIDTIMRIHRASFIDDEKCTWGNLDNNPVQEDISEACLKAKPDFCVNVTLDRDYNITGVYAGDVITAHRKGCEKVREDSMCSVGELFDIVVTTNGGYPLDQNLYQAVKGMHAASRILKPGGSIVSIAECRDGIPAHGNYGSMFKMRSSLNDLLRAIRDEVIDITDKWQVQAQLLIQEKANIYVYSSLPDEDVKGVLMEPFKNFEQLFLQLKAQYGSEARIAVMPEGPYVVPFNVL